MANLTSMGQYEADTRIPSFFGLMQYGDGINVDPRYCTEMKNVDTSDGSFKPYAKASLLPGTLPNKIETLAVLYRRWYVGAEKSVLIAAANNRLYYLNGSTWVQLNSPYLTFASNEWSWISYEINPEGSESPVDVLVMSNPVDGMIYVRCDDVEKSVTQVFTPKKFGVITRYNERIFGGSILSDPDMVMYSAPFDFTDWTQNVEIPEDGAGDIQQPTWDGDSFTALRQIGAQLVAFRKNTVWRVLGTDPGEFAWRQQYGGGTSYENTICIEGERVLMLGDSGLLQYDGMAVAPYYQQFAYEIFQRMNLAALEQSCAVVWKKKYYLSLPLDGSPTNNAVLIYDLDSGAWTFRDDLRVESFLATDNTLYFTSVQTPGRVGVWNEDLWEGESLPVLWVSPWFDFNQKDVMKGGWTFYLTIESKDAGTIKISVETEKKRKSKVYSFPKITRDSRQKRITFGGSGRRFRFYIESDSTTPWRMIGGLQIKTEIDKD